MQEPITKATQSTNRGCPDCGESFHVKRQKFGLLKTLSLGFLGDLGVLLVAIILFAAVSALSFAGAYGMAVIIVFGGGIFLFHSLRGYKCAKCARVFSKQELDSA